MIKSVKRKIIEETTSEFTGDQIISALIRAGYLDKDAVIDEIFVKIPGGGDWSNMNLSIDDEEKLTIKATTIRYE